MKIVQCVGCKDEIEIMDAWHGVSITQTIGWDFGDNGELFCPDCFKAPDTPDTPSEASTSL